MPNSFSSRHEIISETSEEQLNKFNRSTPNQTDPMVETQNPAQSDDGQQVTEAAVGDRARSRWFGRHSTEPTKLEREIQDIGKNIEQLLMTKQADSVQIELARIANLLPYLRDHGDNYRVCNVRAAVAGLQHNSPNLEFAQAVRRATEFYLLRSQRGMFRIVYIIAGTTPLTALIAGVIATSLSMLMAVLLGFFSSEWILTQAGSSRDFIASFEANSVILVAWTILFAAIGSFTSLFVRLGQFAQATLDDPFLTFCTGFFKPYIGIAFALFALATMKSGLIAVGGESLAVLSPPAYMALAFISGFSERFASDFISRAEGRFGALNTPILPTGPSQEPRSKDMGPKA